VSSSSLGEATPRGGLRGTGGADAVKDIIFADGWL
jgi:hypothetical protein